MSIRENLIGEQFVKGNMRKILQSYNLYYYPPEENFPTSKIWLYLNGKENGQPRMIKSLCFENIENHSNFILNNLFYHLYWLEKKGIDFKPSQMNIDTFRKILLDNLMIGLRAKLISKLKERAIKVLNKG